MTPATLAPLTDAGLTPYRGLKKLRAAGVLGAGRTVAVTGIGGLGSYGTQYAKLLGGGAAVVAFARSDEKLKVATDNGADHAINVRDKSAEEVRGELQNLTGRGEIDAVIECAGSVESIQLAFDLLATEGAVASVGLIGNRIDIPLFPLVAREFSYFGSFWGNYNDLTEVLALAEAARSGTQSRPSSSTTSTPPSTRSPRARCWAAPSSSTTEARGQPWQPGSSPVRPAASGRSSRRRRWPPGTTSSRPRATPPQPATLCPTRSDCSPRGWTS